MKILKPKKQLRYGAYFVTFYIILMMIITGIMKTYDFITYQENHTTLTKEITHKTKEEVKNETLREITMYTSTPEQTDASPCIGASGQDQCVLWRNGQNICATNAFPKNTILHIDKLGECLVLDTMNSRFKERIDWYAGYDDECLDGVESGDNCPNYKRAIKFGLQTLNVRVLK